MESVGSLGGQPTCCLLLSVGEEVGGEHWVMRVGGQRIREDGKFVEGGEEKASKTQEPQFKIHDLQDPAIYSRPGT